MKIAKEVEKKRQQQKEEEKNHKSMAAAFLLFIFQQSTIRVALDETDYESSHLTFQKKKTRQQQKEEKKKSSFHIRNFLTKQTMKFLNETDYEIGDFQ